MTYFANGLRLYLMVVLTVVGWQTWTLIRPYLRDAFRRGPSHARHVVKVSMSHVGALGILAVDNFKEWGEGPNYQLGFFVLFGTLTASALIDLIRSNRAAAAGG